MGMFDDAVDTVENTASSVWGGVTDAASSVWNSVAGPKQDDGPISVPVTAADEENARKMVEESDRLNNTPGYKNPYEQQQAAQAQQGGLFSKQNLDYNEAENKKMDDYNVRYAAWEKQYHAAAVNGEEENRKKLLQQQPKPPYGG